MRALRGGGGGGGGSRCGGILRNLSKLLHSDSCEGRSDGASDGAVGRLEMRVSLSCSSYFLY